MTDSTDCSVNEVVNEEVNEETPKVIDVELEKPKRAYKKPEITRAQRLKIIDDDERGIKHDVYEVVMNKNGKKMVRKRKIPLNVNDANEPEVKETDTNEPEVKSRKESKKAWMNDIQLFNFTQAATTSELSKRIDELQAQFTKSENKRKKLKGKYKQIKNDLYADEDDDEPNGYDIVDTNENVNESIENVSETQPVRKPVIRKVNARDVIDYSQFHFQ